MHIAKRLGIAKKGLIFQGENEDSANLGKESKPRIKIGSLFSNMASLPV